MKGGVKMNERKYNQIVSIWGILLIVLQFFTLIYNITTETSLTTEKNITIILSILMLVLLALYMILSLKKNKIGLILGIIAGILYFLAFSFINIIISICFIMSCVSLMKELSKNNS